MKLSRISYLVVIFGFLTWLSSPASSAKIESLEQVQMHTAEVEGVTIHDGTISGRVVNKSSKPIEDVELLVRNIWLWNNEYHPGQDTYSMADYVPLDGTIEPGQSKDFTFDLRLPKASRGHFDTKVLVGEFRTVAAG